MDGQTLIDEFFDAIRDDQRIGPRHISMYWALVHMAGPKGLEDGFYVRKRELMPLTKFSSGTTYHVAMRELDKFGYIRYTPSHDAVQGSYVRFRYGKGG